MNTLYSKLALTLMGLLLAVALAYVLISQSLTQRYMDEADQRFNRDLAKNLVADRELVNQGRIDEAALKETFELYMTINPSIEIYLLDLQGNILAYSADSGVVKRKSVALAPIKAFLSDSTQPVLGDDPRSHDRRKGFSVTAVPSAQAPEGYLYVVLRGEKYDATERLYQESLLLRLSAWILAGSLLFGLLSGLLLFYLLTRRLRRLNRLMAGFRDSQFQHHIAYAGLAQQGDEVEQLGASFDVMASRMQILLNELKEQDALRRELVNNVSHDLRTPLTSLHGYLETLKLKSKQMEPKQRAQYLQAAIAHSERLGKLIAELFELAKLDARAVKPQPELFSAAELLHDVAQKFELLAERQQVCITFDADSAGVNAFANADIGLIERVLENLISNALAFTPAQGRIVLALEQGQDALSISVCDTGTGIAEQDLAHVFERYYRSSQNRHNGGAGLGLAIAKRIVELHGGELSVSSVLKQGTCFKFSLPMTQTSIAQSSIAQT